MKREDLYKKRGEVLRPISRRSNISRYSFSSQHTGNVLPFWSSFQSGLALLMLLIIAGSNLIFPAHQAESLQASLQKHLETQIQIHFPESIESLKDVFKITNLSSESSDIAAK